MPTVLIPSLLRPLTSGASSVRVAGRTLREVVDSLDAVHPGIKGRICDGDRLEPSISLAVNGEVTQLGLLQPVDDESEIQILPAISGG